MSVQDDRLCFILVIKFCASRLCSVRYIRVQRGCKRAFHTHRILHRDFFEAAIILGSSRVHVLLTSILLRSVLDPIAII